MSTIGGLTGSTTNSIRGYGGLASGLDRDSLIEGMTYGTTSKITQQQQKKQQLEWKQSAVQSITNQMISFANKFTSSWSSSTNLFSSVFWGRNKITTTGANSKFVSVSGSSSTADAIKIAAVKQLAQKAKLSSKESVTDNVLTTGGIDAGKTQKLQQLVGETLEIKYGNTTSYIYLNTTDKDGNTLQYDTPEHAVDSIKKMLGEEEITDSSGKTVKLSEVVTVSYSQGADGKGHFMFTGKAGGNALAVTGGSALEYMGFEKEEGVDFDLTDGGVVTAKNSAEGITRDVSFAEMVANKRLTFNYNGVTKDITIADMDTLLNGVTHTDGKPVNEAEEAKVLENLRKSIETEMDKAFGKGRIQVAIKEVDDGNGNKLNKLEFTTTKPAGGTNKVDDPSSSLTLVSGSIGLVGEGGALNVKEGESTKLNLNAKLSEAGFKGVDWLNSNETSRMITINGQQIEVTKETTMQKLMDDIKEKAGVDVSYQALTGKFTFTSQENGMSGSITLGTPKNADGTQNDEDGNKLLQQLFGIKDDNIGTTVNGQDAIVSVKYAGSDEAVDLYRDSNTFTIDGLTISLKGEFGYKTVDGEKIVDTSAEEVEINAQVDADSIVTAVKDMVEEYNKIIEQVNKELNTKPDRDYEPLTSEQKKELSEDEIKLYEEKAKQGLLFGDSDLRSLSSDLRFIISGGIAQELENMGISTSSTYSDNGKLTFDESKFRAALESDPERVQELFSGSDIANQNGTGTSKGIAANLKDVMDKYVNTMGSWDSKGVLIRKAGTESSPLSLTENFMYKQIVEYNKQIAKLQELLETERDRYIKQFTSLETLISQMNSQSNYLSQIGGY